MTKRSTDRGEGATEAAERIRGFKTPSDLQSRPQGNRPDGRKWRWFFLLFHDATQPIMWHFTLITDGHKVAAGV